MTQKIALPTREEMDQEYCWKLEDIFETDELWMDSCTAVSYTHLQLSEGRAGVRGRHHDRQQDICGRD